MNSIKKIVLTLSVLLAFFAGDALAQCGGKTVYIELPSGWSGTTYITWSGSFVSITGTKEGIWTKFTLPTTLSDDNQVDKAEIIFIDFNDHYNQNGMTHFVTKTEIGENKNIPSTNKFLCSDFGDNGTWIQENPNRPGQTALSHQPPNAFYFYFLPPKGSEWALGIPYLAWRDGNTIKKEKLALDSRCGWYKKVYFNSTPPDADTWVWLNGNKAQPDDQVGDKGLDEDPLDWQDERPIPFNLAQRFGDQPGDLFFVAAEGENGWRKTDNNLPNGTCEYTFAAIIYDTDASVNSSFVDNGGSGNGTGVAKNIPGNTLVNGKMTFNQAKDNWTQNNFLDAFKPTDGKNVVRCYDMPFKRNKSGLWEFNSNKLCADGSMDLEGNCNNNYMGGYFPPELQTRGTADYSKCSSCDQKRKAEPWVPLTKSKQSQYCYDRALVGTGDDNCSSTALGAEGDFQTGDAPAKTAFWDWGNRAGIDGTAKEAQKNQFFCFESAPATFIYEKGQEFFFSGDDDIWVFINNKLEIDLGGTHLAAPGYVNLDKLNLTEGDEYNMNIFFCDRRTTMSNVRIATNMYFAQESGILVNGVAKEGGADICLQQDGGAGSCAGFASGATTGSQTLCGDATNGKLEFYVINRKGDSQHTLNLENGDCRATGNPGEYRCYGGITVNVSNGKAKVDAGSVSNLPGTWYLYVKVIDPKIQAEDMRLAMIAAQTFVRTAWGEIREATEGGRLLTNICKQNPTAATGEWVPVCFSSGDILGNNFLTGDDVEYIAGSTFKLNSTGFFNHLGNRLKVAYDSLGSNPVDWNTTFALPSAADVKPNSGSVPGVLVLWVTGDYAQEDNPDTYIINVSNRAATEQVTLNSVIPELQWIKEAGATTGLTVAQARGSKWNIPGDPTSGVLMRTDDPAKMAPVWVGEEIKLHLRAHRDGKTCKTCIYDLSLAAEANEIPEKNSNLILSTGLKIVNGEATLGIAGKKDVQDPKFAQITVQGVSSKSKASWYDLQFEEPPVPYPENTRIFDVDGDGIGDSIVIAYNRGFDKDSLPNAIEVAWGKDTTIIYGIGTRNKQLSNGDTVYSVVDPAQNRSYWASYIKGSPNLENRPGGTTLKDIRDTIILVRGPKGEDDVHFSKDILTKSESGKIANWVSFRTGTADFDISIGGNIEDRIPAIVISARYAADENNKGCGGSPSSSCRDKVTLEFSEPVKIDPDAGDLSEDELKNTFAYMLRDIGKSDWDVLGTAFLSPSMRYNKSGTIRPSEDGNDSIVSMFFNRYREGDNKSGTPMPGDSVKFASLGKYAGFAKNILVDTKGNPPNQNEKGRQIEGRKPFTPDKLPIGEIDPNYPDYVLNITETLDRDGSSGYDKDNLFNKDRPIELLPVPPDCNIQCIKEKYPGTIGMIFNPDIFNELADLEDLYGPISDGNITIYPKVFYHTNLGSYVADRGFSVKCDDPIFPRNDKGQPSCKDNRSKFYVAWDMKDFKGRFVGAGAYVGLYDFYWDVYIPSINQTQKKESIERKVEMHGVKRTKKK